ncbi:hypothetical protein ACS0TY_006892 [Phlomoides rotata]
MSEDRRLVYWRIFQSLLCDPNPNSPANSEAARMFSENKREYNRRAGQPINSTHHWLVWYISMEAFESLKFVP